MQHDLSSNNARSMEQMQLVKNKFVFYTSRCSEGVPKNKPSATSINQINLNQLSCAKAPALRKTCYSKPYHQGAKRHLKPKKPSAHFTMAY